ncbi:DUF6247 family protein [Streptomyces sp. ISL-94]|uniref:DUF6247 family protein n=1 Tax=Streptomyces sp. ISL-94 TaxID=2819190 RepID=UPI001BE5DE8F|nr:DUF6247 family protein [Streptomyces sp. ISL-94]MBT2476708.1 hypothetical protein [Streptomyces sp. ISL-94]
MTTATPAPGGSVPPMPEYTPKALRAAMAARTPALLPDFDAAWRQQIADAYDIGPVPAFMARWWGEYALARDPELDRRVNDLEARAAETTDAEAARKLLNEASRIRHELRALEPGE